MNRDERKIRSGIQGFHAQMLDAMLAGMDDGKTGWDNPQSLCWKDDFEKEICSRIRRMLKSKFEGNEVDAANYLFMLQYLRFANTTKSKR
jgi:hypothetical protein